MARLLLSVAVDPADSLCIVAGVPRHVHHDHTTGGHQVDPKAAGPVRGEGRVVEEVGANRIEMSLGWRPVVFYDTDASHVHACTCAYTHAPTLVLVTCNTTARIGYVAPFRG